MVQLKTFLVCALLLLCLPLAHATNRPTSIQFSVPALSEPFYLKRLTIISSNVTNLGADSLQVTTILAQMVWPPRNTSVIVPQSFVLAPNEQRRISISVQVPSWVIPTTMKYRLGINTTVGVWFDVWRTNVARDYWYDAYASLRSSIKDRLTDRTYASPDANEDAKQAVDLLNDAELNHFGTEEGYNKLLQASKLIDQADLAEANYLAQRENMPFYLLCGIGLVAIGLVVLAFVKLRGHKKKKHRPHGRT